ncbi:MAG: stage III sporulation protein AA, partial [Lachnospiraceae bacterium]|nr:stage III sporulation protein AA [Lachnospiraceae bacterium]
DQMAADNRILQFFPQGLRVGWERSGVCFDQVQEIRLRVNQAVRVLSDREHRLPMIYGEREMEEIFRYLCHDSVYAYEEERKQGYIVVEGGHRIGITGELTTAGNGRFIAKYIRYMNIRLAHEHKGIAKKMIRYLYHNTKEGEPLNTLIISPPGVGKTTLLRDTIRLMSSGSDGYRGCNVGVIDERGEIAGAYRGSAMLDCGERTDIVTGGDKQQGISILVRTFAPRVIAIDEIGKSADAEAILHAGVSGCSILATVHGNSIEDIRHKAEMEQILHLGLIDRFVVLSIDAKMERYFEVYDREGNRLCGRNLLQVPA